MEFTARNVFDCDVPTAFAMLTDPAFLEQVAQVSNPTDFTITASPALTRTERTLTSAPPASAFTGAEVGIIDEIIWNEPEAGEYRGTASVALVDLPLSLTGDVRLFPEGSTSVLEYSGELSVDIPVVGKKLEKIAAPLLLKGIEYQQLIADDWLAPKASG